MKNNGPCAKQIVTATLISSCGKEFISTNWCESPQKVCPRLDLPTGEGYELCRDICKQKGHAEINAINLAGEFSKGSTIFLSGHHYACDKCQSYADSCGVLNIVINNE